MLNQMKILLVDSLTCPGDWHWESHRNGWRGYHIWYVMGGGASITVDGTHYQLIPGDCFLFDLDKNHICSHDPNHPLQVATVYAHADDLPPSAVRRWLVRGDPILGELIRRCVEWFPRDPAFAEIWLRSAFLPFLSEPPQKITLSPPVAKIRGELEHRMHVCLSLEDMCAMTGYSKNQIIRLFRKDTGMTPIQFQMARKMEFAAKLLLYSNQTITQIGAQVGMEDSNYFSKTFRKYIGESPRSYRNRLRTE